MLYHYVAADRAGKVVEGDLEANELKDALRIIAGKELQPVSVKEMAQKQGAKGGIGKINVSDKVFLTKYLALMLRVGTDLLSAINILIADFEKPAMKNFLIEVRENLSHGQPFFEAFARYPKVFSGTFISLIRAAETSGNLQQTFEDLSQDLEKEAALRSKIKSAMVYPIILVCVATSIMIFLVTFALPKVSSVFSQGGIKPPFFSQVVFTVGLFFGRNILIIVPGVAGIIGICMLLVKKTEIGARTWTRIITKLPIVKGLYSDIAVQRMASTMSSLLKAGLPVVQTITVAAETVGVKEYRDALLRVANDGLAKGLTIGEAFRRESVFPSMVSNLVAISEKAGHLEEVLATLSDFYGANIDGNIKALVSLLEPLMLLMMGVVVATIALAIIVPIYQLTTNF